MTILKHFKTKSKTPIKVSLFIMESLNYVFEAEKKQKSTLTFELQDLKISSGVENIIIPLSLILGANIYEPKPGYFRSKFELHYFVEEKKKSTKQKLDMVVTRSLKSFVFYHDNFENVKNFKLELLRKIHSRPDHKFEQKTDPITNKVYYKNLMVLVNPNSGSKSAESVYERLSLLLSAHGARSDLMITKPGTWTEDLARTMEKEQLLSYDAVVVLSGDGTPHQFLNGVMKRDDIDFENDGITLHLVPVGSACALSENVCKMSKSVCSVENSLFLLCSFQRKKFHLKKHVFVNKEKEAKTIWGFMTAMYGFLSDVDIKSEFLRFMGQTRFDIYGAFQLTKKLAYTTKVILPEEEKEEEIPDPLVPIPNQGVLELNQEIYSFYASLLPYIGKNYLSSPNLWAEQGFFDIQVFPANEGRIKFTKYILNHTEHEELNPNLIQKKAQWYRIYLEDKPDKKNYVIDGETYSSLDPVYVQAEITNRFFYVLLG